MYDHEQQQQQQDDPLQKQFKTLQKEWDSIKQSFSRSNRRSSTTTTVAGDHRGFHPYEDSPKELMTLLQNEYSPAKDAFEINEAEADFDEESGVSTEVSYKGFENYDKRNFDEKYNQLSGFGGSCTGSSRLDEGKGVKVAAKSGGGGGGSCTGSSRLDVAEKGGRAAAVKGGGGAGKWFVSLVVMLFALAIVALECSSEHKSILVPT